MHGAPAPAAAGRFPVAIGGVGGSGTRIGAAFLVCAGYYVGDDVNDMLDNLWFTLLFKHRSVLLEDAAGFARLAHLFAARMAGGAIPEGAGAVLPRLLEERIQHDQVWLEERASSFLRVTAPHGRPWGWKEPNTHVVIDRLLALDPALRYIHFVRHPLDMALSSNMQQLENWGPLFLNRDVELEPRDALAYWCAAHRRVARIVASEPDRCLIVEFDAFCADPRGTVARLADFLGIAREDPAYEPFFETVRRPPSSGRAGDVPLDRFDSKDLLYVASLGYAVGRRAPRTAAASPRG